MHSRYLKGRVCLSENYLCICKARRKVKVLLAYTDMSISCHLRSGSLNRHFGPSSHVLLEGCSRSAKQRSVIKPSILRPEYYQYWVSQVLRSVGLTSTGVRQRLTDIGVTQHLCERKMSKGAKLTLKMIQRHETRTPFGSYLVVVSGVLILQVSTWYVNDRMK